MQYIICERRGGDASFAQEKEGGGEGGVEERNERGPTMLRENDKK